MIKYFMFFHCLFYFVLLIVRILYNYFEHGNFDVVVYALMLTNKG
jgi:hypothetical protein